MKILIYFYPKTLCHTPLDSCVTFALLRFSTATHKNSRPFCHPWDWSFILEAWKQKTMFCWAGDNYKPETVTKSNPIISSTICGEGGTSQACYSAFVSNLLPLIPITFGIYFNIWWPMPPFWIFISYKHTAWMLIRRDLYIQHFCWGLPVVLSPRCGLSAWMHWSCIDEIV